MATAFPARVRQLAPQAAVFLAYLGAAGLGRLMVFPSTDAPAVWPPSGVAVAAALLLGSRIWPAIAVGALVVQAIALAGRGLAPQVIGGVSLATAVGNTLAALVGAAIVRRVTRGRAPLDRPRDVGRFIFFGAFLATTISASIGVYALSRLAMHYALGSRAWMTWWLGDVTGVLVMAPVIMTWRVRPRSLDAARVTEIGVLLLLLSVVMWGIAENGALGRFLFIPFLIWAGARFGRFECSVITLLFGLVSTIATVFGMQAWANFPLHITLLNHEAYVAIVSSSLLLLVSMVHQWKFAQRAAEAGENRFRSLFELHPSMMFVVDSDNGALIDANPAASKYYGYPRQVLRNMNIAQINALPADEFRALRQRVSRREMDAFVTTHRLATGEERRVEVHTSPAESGGRPARFSIITDVTNRERTEQTKTLLSSIVSSSEDAIISRDLKGRILTWNAGAERMFGYSAREMIGGSPASLIPEGRVDDFDGVPGDRSAGHSVVHFETERLHKDGHPIALSVSVSPLTDDSGQLLGDAIIARDITERKALTERLLHSQKLESLGTLAGGVAHDFNNMLTAIMGYTELMKADMCGECPLQPSLGPIEGASKQAKRLAGSLLAFSRKQVMIPSPIGVNDLVKESAGLLRRLIGEHIELVLDLDPAAPLVLVDTGQIAQVMMNLATNARDAMPSGGALTICTRLCDPDPLEPPGPGGAGEPRVRITISDTGQGIDEAVRNRIFEPFFTTKERGRGTGLGLSIAHGIIDQHGGTLRLEATPGPGATFTIRLPAIAKSESSWTDEPSRGCRAATSSSWSSRTIGRFGHSQRCCWSARDTPCSKRRTAPRGSRFSGIASRNSTW